jgi:hypothetical protein
MADRVDSKFLNPTPLTISALGTEEDTAPGKIDSLQYWLEFQYHNPSPPWGAELWSPLLHLSTKPGVKADGMSCYLPHFSLGPSVFFTPILPFSLQRRKYVDVGKYKHILPLNCPSLLLLLDFQESWGIHVQGTLGQTFHQEHTECRPGEKRT